MLTAPSRLGALARIGAQQLQQPEQIGRQRRLEVLCSSADRMPQLQPLRMQRLTTKRLQRRLTAVPAPASCRCRPP